jgi:hypothetical protein
VTRDEPLAGVEPSKLSKVRPHELAIRFAFGAAISLLAGAVSLIFGPKAGGLFLAFPAILPATLTLIEKKENTREAVHDVEGAVFGALGLVAFAVTAEWALPEMHVAAALGLAFAAWVLVSLTCYLTYHALMQTD